MSLKQTIADGEIVLKTIDDTIAALTDIDDAIGTPSMGNVQLRATKLLISIQLTDFESRKRTTMNRLAKLRKDYALEFEKQSIEANSGIFDMIKIAETFIGKDPKQITDLIPPVIEYYNKNAGDFTQEERNTVYFKLKGHVNFLKKRYKA